MCRNVVHMVMDNRRATDPLVPTELDSSTESVGTTLHKHLEFWRSLHAGYRTLLCLKSRSMEWSVVKTCLPGLTLISSLFTTWNETLATGTLRTSRKAWYWKHYDYLPLLNFKATSTEKAMAAFVGSGEGGCSMLPNDYPPLKTLIIGVYYSISLAGFRQTNQLGKLLLHYTDTAHASQLVRDYEEIF